MNHSQFSRGIYIVFCDDDSIADTILEGITPKVMLNLGRRDSLKVLDYFKRNKLRWTENQLGSYSEIPNQLLSGAADLLLKTDCLIVGTAGLSKNSILEVSAYLNKITDGTRKVFLIHYTHAGKTSNPEFWKITPENSGQI